MNFVGKQRASFHTKRGALVLIADPGRASLPAQGLEELARYVVPTSRDLEDRGERETRVLRVLP